MEEAVGKSVSEFENTNELLEKKILVNKELISKLGGLVEKLGSLEPLESKPQSDEKDLKSGTFTHLYKLSNLSEKLSQNNNYLEYLVKNLERVV